MRSTSPLALGSIVIIVSALVAVAPTSAQTRILCLGDSITHGGDLGHASYRYPLWNMLQAAGDSVDFVGSRQTVNGGDGGAIPDVTMYPDYYTTFDRDHEGYWGWTTGQILGIVDAAAQAALPDVVLVHLGTNDIGQSGAAGVATARANLATIIERLRLAQPNVTILLSQVVPIGPGSGYFANTDQVVPLNAQIADLVAESDNARSRVVLVDQFTGFDAVTDMQPDGIHPNIAGETRMAATWFATLRLVLDDDLPPVGMAGRWSFETPTLADGVVHYGAGAGSGVRFRFDSRFELAGIENPLGRHFKGADGASSPLGTDGRNVAFLARYRGTGTPMLSFSTEEVLRANRTYRLRVAVGDRVMRDGRHGVRFGGFRIRLVAGANVVAESVDAFMPRPGTFHDAVLAVRTNDLPSTLIGQPLEVHLSMTGSATDISTDFDDIRLDVTLDVPTTLTFGPEFSFEVPTLADGALVGGPGTLGGWDFQATGANVFAGIYNPPATSYTGAVDAGEPLGGHGSNVAYLVDGAGGASVLEITRDLETSLRPGRDYFVGVAVGNRLPSSPYTGSVFGGYRIELLAGSTVVASESDAVAPSAGTFADVTFRVAASALASGLVGQPLSLRLSMMSSAAGAFVDFDNVRFNDLPELASFPATEASFEIPVLTDGGAAGPGRIAGWILAPFGAGRAEITNPVMAAYAGAAGNGTPNGADGANVCSLEVGPATGFPTVLRDLPVLLESGLDYDITVAIGRPSVDPGGGVATFAGYRVELVAGGTVLAFDADDFVPAAGTFMSTTVSIPADSFDLGLIGCLLRVRLSATSTTPGAVVDFDDVRFSMAAPSATADPAEFDFEIPTVTDGNVFAGPGVFGGWIFNGGSGTFIGIFNPPDTSYTAATADLSPVGASGSNVAYMVDGGGGAALSIERLVGANLQANTTYDLTVAVGNRLPSSPYSGTIFGGYRIELLAGGSVIATDVDGFVPSVGMFQDAVASVDSTTVLPALIGTSLSIRLSMSTPGPSTFCDFDDVRLVVTSN